MALQPMYPAFNDSTPTTLTSMLSATATTISVESTAVFPDPPGIVSIGDADGTELVIYHGKTATALTGALRGIHGTPARIWPESTLVSRAFTSYDHDTFKGNIEDLDSRKLDADGDGSNVTTAFETAETRTNISGGQTLAVIFARIKRYLTDLKAGAFADFGTASNQMARGDHAHEQYLTAETDPTVPAWAKETQKPSYTAAEVGAIAAETDPTVPAWAKAAQKPSYTAAEVGAVTLTGGKADPAQVVASSIDVTASKTLALTDAGTLQKVTATSAVTVTVPTDASVALPVDTEIEIVQYGPATVTITPASGVTLNSPDGARSVGTQFGAVSLKKMAANEWWMEGRLG